MMFDSRRGTLTVALVALLSNGCGPSSSQPTALPAVVVTEQQNPTPQRRTISGSVAIYDALGDHPVAGIEVWRWLEWSRGGSAEGAVLTDADGKFSFDTLAGVTVYLFAARNGLYQPCVASVLPDQTQADVKMVQVKDVSRAMEVPNLIVGPTLTGIIFEATASGPQPVVNAGVIVDGLSGDGVSLASTRTDERGRYLVCGLGTGQWQALAVYKEGYQVAVADTPRSGTGVLDVELRR